MNVYVVSQESSHDSSDTSVLLYSALTDAVLSDIAQVAFDSAGIASDTYVRIDYMSIDTNVRIMSMSWRMPVFVVCFHPSPRAVKRATSYCRSEDVVSCFEDVIALQKVGA